MHKIFGIKENVEYIDREGAYLIPILNNQVGVIQTSKGYFFLGGGLENGESHITCIERECIEETGYEVSVGNKVCSAETYGEHPAIGYFHPIQTYYVGELGSKVSVPTEKDHTFLWMEYDKLKGKMYVEMQNWALEQCTVIKKVDEKDIAACVKVIKESFITVADEFGFTVDNAPLFTAFAMTEDNLKRQLLEEHRPMYAFFDQGTIVGFYSLLLQDNRECELNNLCVSPAYRHKRIGEGLLQSAFENARELGCVKMNIGIVEENKVLRKWYESHGFVHTGTQKFDFFPFTCGYMEKNIESDNEITLK